MSLFIYLSRSTFGAQNQLNFALRSSFLPGIVFSVEGATFSISRVNRLHMGPYLCIASNGVPPSVSKRVSLIVHCKWFPIGSSVTISSAFPGREALITFSLLAVPPMIYVQVSALRRDDKRAIKMLGSFDFRRISWLALTKVSTFHSTASPKRTPSRLITGHSRKEKSSPKVEYL